MSEARTFYERKIHRLPEDWEVLCLDSIASKVGSGITPRGGREVYLDEGIPFIRSQNVLVGRLDFSDIAFISEEQHEEMSNTKLQPFDVLLNITGASIGRCCIVPDSIHEGNVNQHVCIIRSNGRINPYFLMLLLNSDIGQKQIWQFQAGGNRQGLNFEQIRGFALPLPPLPEQRRIAEIISTWDEAIALYELLIGPATSSSKTGLLVKQREGLMQRLLMGQVRVGV
jgi:type I restriction enzyme S subunit